MTLWSCENSPMKMIKSTKPISTPAMIGQQSEAKLEFSYNLVEFSWLQHPFFTQ